jgi:hypothetical protein
MYFDFTDKLQMAKKKNPKLITIAGLAYTLLFAGAGARIVNRDNDDKCGGKERWEQKILIDDETSNIKTRPVITTIESLNSISTAAYNIKGETARQDIEKQIYKIKGCFITHAILENDNDLHLVIEDGHNHTMVAEIPDIKCKEAKSSEYIDDFRQARNLFLKYQNVFNQYRFDVTGVLFIDKKHAKPPTGNAGNNIELHPVIALKATKF